MGEPSGLTGVMGVGVQGLAEAPWLKLGSSPLPAGGGRTAWRTLRRTGRGTARTARAGSGPVRSARAPGTTCPLHTLVVHRDQGERVSGGPRAVPAALAVQPAVGVLALILALGIGLGLGGWWLAACCYSAIPVVTGDSVTTATTALTVNGFTAARVSRVTSNAEPKGTVVGTSPSGRVILGEGWRDHHPGRPGRSTRRCPTSTAHTLTAAEAALQRVHLSTVTEKVGSDSPVGSVLGTNPQGRARPGRRPAAAE